MLKCLPVTQIARELIAAQSVPRESDIIQKFRDRIYFDKGIDCSVAWIYGDIRIGRIFNYDRKRDLHKLCTSEKFSVNWHSERRDFINITISHNRTFRVRTPNVRLIVSEKLAKKLFKETLEFFKKLTLAKIFYDSYYNNFTLPEINEIVIREFNLPKNLQILR